MKTLFWVVVIATGSLVVMASRLWVSAEAGLAAMVGVVTIWSGCVVAFNHYYSVRRLLSKHIRLSATEATTVSESIEEGLRIDVFRSLEHFRQTSGGQKVIGTSESSLTDVIDKDPWESPLQSESLPVSPTANETFVVNGIYRLIMEGQPVVAALGEKDLSLEVVAPNNEIAKRVLDLLLTWAKDHSIYRGAIVAIDTNSRGGWWKMRFLELPPVDRESIILPDEVLRSVERNVLGVLKHTAVLRQLGQSTRCGVLLHGSPGTGKTLVTRYLASNCTGHTVIVLTGQNLGFVRQACRLAKILAPSVVIMEDVDLIAGDRENNRHSSLLHDLMDEMNGLGKTSDRIFVLTSNQPEALEAALASRPGRVDQAIHFPLPDVACRRRLLELYSNGLDVHHVDIDLVIEKTESASPAFIRELVRRATLLSAERSEPGKTLELTTEDFEAALDELINVGGDLTSGVLGFHPKAGFLTESD